MILRIKGKTLVEYVFLSFLFISQVYYGYRYVLQYNSAATSPTYSDTPLPFQIGKYIIALFIFYLMIPTFLLAVPASSILKKRKLDTLNINIGIIWLFLILYVGYIWVSCFKFVPVIPQDIKGLFFMPLVLLMPYFYRGKPSLKLYLKVGVWGLIYHIVYSFYQFGNYIFFSRLPALAYPGGLIRFGGGWDDPNGFGMFLILPILSLLGMRRLLNDTWKRYSYVLLAVLIALVFLTVSVSAISMLILALLLYGFFKDRKTLLVFFFLICLIGVLFYAYPDYIGYIKTIYMWKSESIMGHLTGMLQLSDYIENSFIFSLLFGQSSEWVFNENFYIQSFINHGLIGLAFLFCTIFFSLIYGFSKVKLAREHSDVLVENVLPPLLIYIIVFAIGSVGIPFYNVFPTNLFFWLAIAITVLTPVKTKSLCQGNSYPTRYLERNRVYSRDE